MQRRKILATAGAIGATAVAATIALGANLGLFGLTESSGAPGDFQLVDSKPPRRAVVTKVVDVPVPVSAPTEPSERREAPEPSEPGEDD